MEKEDQQELPLDRGARHQQHILVDAVWLQRMLLSHAQPREQSDFLVLEVFFPEHDAEEAPEAHGETAAAFTSKPPRSENSYIPGAVSVHPSFFEAGSACTTSAACALDFRSPSLQDCGPPSPGSASRSSPMFKDCRFHFATAGRKY